MQLLAVVFIINCLTTLHVSGVLSTHHQEYIKTVGALTGTNHVSMWCKFRSVKRRWRTPVYLFASIRLNIIFARCSRKGEFPKTAVLFKCAYMPAAYSRRLTRREYEYIVRLQLHFIVVQSGNPFRKLNYQWFKLKLYPHAVNIRYQDCQLPALGIPHNYWPSVSNPALSEFVVANLTQATQVHISTPPFLIYLLMSF